MNETEKIMDSQRILGLRPKVGEKGRKIDTVKAAFSLIIPQCVRSFYYAAQIAVTLRYRGSSPEFFKLPRMAVKDYFALTAALAVPLLILTAGI
jgi:energy-coupling factor transporter transmembrane protein EcfT